MSEKPEEYESSEYSVCQFFKDGTYEYTRRYVSISNAVEAFKHYATSVATRLGLIDRVIITDGGDCTIAEWKHGEGITWPPQKEEISE